MTRPRPSAALAAAAVLLAPAAASAADLAVRIEGVRDRPGRLLVCLWTPGDAAFPACGGGGARARAEAAPAEGTVVVRFPGLPPGDYAVSVLHDEDGDRRLATGFFGQPREGVGFSAGGGPPPRRAPVFDDARFRLEGDAEVAVRMVYP